MGEGTNGMMNYPLNRVEWVYDRTLRLNAADVPALD